MATIKITYPQWRIEQETGYKPITSFWRDFSIAERFGVQAIRKTYQMAFEEWKGNCKYLTELVLVLNHKIFQYWVKDGTDEQNSMALLYNELYQRANIYALDNLHGEEAEYFYKCTD